jgi:hypothetical protein
LQLAGVCRAEVQSCDGSEQRSDERELVAEHTEQRHEAERQAEADRAEDPDPQSPARKKSADRTGAGRGAHYVILVQ